MENNPKTPSDTCPLAKVLEREAWQFAHQSNIEVGVLPFGDKVIHNGPPYIDRHNMVEYEFQFAGDANYVLAIEYAAKDPRPCTLKWNSKVLPGNIGMATDGWEEDYQKWEVQGVVTGGAGMHRFRIERAHPFPHIRKIRLTLQE